MLEIITEGLPVDLKPDTEISITIENPFMTADSIPVPYSFTYELPLSPRNREIFGFPDRSASKEWFKSRETRILFNGIEIAYGQQTIDEVAKTLNVNFNGALFPDNVRQALSSRELGKINLGKAVINKDGRRGDYYSQTAIRNYYNNFLLESTLMVYPSTPYIVAAPMGIKNVEWKKKPLRIEFSINRTFFINGFSTLTPGYIPSSREYIREGGIHLNKILPAFSVGIILNSILGDKLQNNIFKSTEWKRLMLVSVYHPAYQTDNNTPVYDLDRKTDEASIAYADFLPAIPSNDFVAEMLKLPCAALYIKGKIYRIELRQDILARTIINDWSGKIIGNTALSKQARQKYRFGYTNTAGAIPADTMLTPVSSIREMYADAESTIYESEDDLKTYEIITTGQVIEALLDPDSVNQCKFNVLRQAMSLGELDIVTQDDESSDTYDISFSGNVSDTNLRHYFDTDYVSGLVDNARRKLYYMPEIEAPSEERPSDFVVGLYHGMRDSIVFDSKITTINKYPYMTHCNYDAYGNRLGDLSLIADGPDGLIENYHKDFKAWIEKDKTVLKANVLLTAEDLNKLDLRDKFYINGITYFIKTLTVTITARRIKPAEVEFVEV